MMDKTYPKNPAEWQRAIEHGIGLNAADGQQASRNGTFPEEQLAQWIRESFSAGFSPVFVPALLRNIKGLVSWVYGDGGEPFWPGSDEG